MQISQVKMYKDVYFLPCISTGMNVQQLKIGSNGLTASIILRFLSTLPDTFAAIGDNVYRTGQYTIYYRPLYIQVDLPYLFFYSNTLILHVLMVQVVLFPYQHHFFQYL